MQKDIKMQYESEKLKVEVSMIKFAYAELRSNNTVPDEVLLFMKDAAIQKLINMYGTEMDKMQLAVNQIKLDKLDIITAQTAAITKAFELLE